MPLTLPMALLLVMTRPLPLDNHLGDGVLDNIIIDSAVHRWWGGFTVVTLLVVVAMVGRHVMRKEAVSASTRWGFLVAQIALVVQALLGIKLLDQGQGILQLYIHYIGGLVPLGAFLVAGWMARGDSPRSARFLLILMLVGLVSGAMAYTIGQAYVNQALTTMVGTS